MFALACLQAFSFLVLSQKLCMAVFACCGVIVAGFLFGIKEEEESELNLSLIGDMCGVLAVCGTLCHLYQENLDSCGRQYFGGFRYTITPTLVVFLSYYHCY